MYALLAGALFAGDMLLWAQAILEIGAGLSTVIVNLQVVLVPVLAWLVDRERVPRRYLPCVGVMLFGVVLTAGILDHRGAAHSTSGTVHATIAALCYAGFLFLLRRGGHSGHVTESYAMLTVSAAAVSLGVGALWHGITVTPGWTATGWLLVTALTGQVIGWLLVAVSTPRLPSHVGPVLLLFTPVGALILGAAVLGERPTPPQLLGGALILVGAYLANRDHKQAANH